MAKPQHIVNEDGDGDGPPPKKPALGSSWPVGQWHFQSGMGYIPVDYDPIAKRAPGVWAVKEPDGTILFKNIPVPDHPSASGPPAPEPPPKPASSQPSSPPFQLTPPPEFTPPPELKPPELKPPKPQPPSLEFPKLKPPTDPFEPSFEPSEGSEGSEEGGCFAAGTLVATPGGPRAIDELVAGDAVLCFDERARSVVAGVVTRHWKHEDRPCVVLDVDGTPDLVVTAAHRFLAADGCWVAAGALTAGSRLAGVDGASPVVRGRADAGAHQVHNLSCAPHPTFLVEGLVVHNVKISDPELVDEIEKE